MSFPKSEQIWMNGTLVPWDDAKVHIGCHVIHYGSAVFEGLRCYATPEGPAVFRLDAHTERLYNSAKIYRMDVPYSPAEVNHAVLETVAANKMDALDDPDRLARLEQHLQSAGVPLYPVSAVTGQGLDALLEAVWREVARAREEGSPVPAA